MYTSDIANGRNPGKKEHYSKVVSKKGTWNNKVYCDEDSLSLPSTWNKARLVFVNSMSDLFHKEVPTEFIMKVFDVMSHYDKHTYQVLTKRAERLEEVASRLNWSKNIWMGVSVENQKNVFRVDHLRNVPAEVRFLSIEPLVGKINQIDLTGIHWVIVGGESGPGARPMDKKWVDYLCDLCVEQDVPFFFKQWGGVNKKKTGRLLNSRTWDEMPKIM